MLSRSEPGSQGAGADPHAARRWAKATCPTGPPGTLRLRASYSSGRRPPGHWTPGRPRALPSLPDPSSDSEPRRQPPCNSQSVAPARGCPGGPPLHLFLWSLTGAMLESLSVLLHCLLYSCKALSPQSPACGLRRILRLFHSLMHLGKFDRHPEQVNRSTAGSGG